jgi:CHAT domain-containing protein/Tfp pilus assembly protein PilF
MSSTTLAARSALVLALVLGALPAASARQLPEALEQARATLHREGPAAALPALETVLAAARDAGDRLTEGAALRALGGAYRALDRIADARSALERALEVTAQSGDALENGKTRNSLGLLEWQLGRYPQATSQLERAATRGGELGEAELEGAALNNLGLVRDELGEYARSRDLYRRALALYERVGFERGASDALGNLGGVDLLLGRYADALEWYRRALEIGERLGLGPSMSVDLLNIGFCHHGLGEYERAIEAFDRSLELARAGDLAWEEADALRGKATALAALGRLEEALALHRDALAAYQRGGLRQPQVEALAELGALHLRLGDVAAAEESFQRGAALAREIGNVRGVTSHLLALGAVERRRVRLDPAAALYREVTERAREAGDGYHETLARIELALVRRDQGGFELARREAQAAVEAARALDAPPLVASALWARGEAERVARAPETALAFYDQGAAIAVDEPAIAWRLAHGRARSLEALGRGDESVAAYRRAIEIIETVRDGLVDERYRSGFLEDKVEVYVEAARLLVRLQRVGPAFALAERLRARSLLDLLSRGGDRDRPLTAIENRLAALDRQIESELARPAAERRDAAIALLRSERSATIRAEERRSSPAVRLRDPRWREAEPPAVEDVQRALAAGVALVEYLLSEDELMVFVLTGDDVRVLRRPLDRRDLEARIDLLRGLIGRTGTDHWLAPARALAEQLVEPLEQAGWLAGVDRLLLVPHGVLHYVPFAVLARAGGGQDVRLLVEDYDLAVLPAAATLVHHRARSREPATKRVLAMAPSRARLGHAEAEASHVGLQYAGRGLVLTGRLASERFFKSQAHDYRILHLATHGRLDRVDPLSSAVELEPGEGEDGDLQVREILGLELDAELVTLSACETALGHGFFAEVPEGDDFVGLTRAFLIAGSRSVLASLWPVDDRSTLELMRLFYSEHEERGGAGALAAAQRTMLAEGPYRHPHFWAAFVMVGWAG